MSKAKDSGDLGMFSAVGRALRGGSLDYYPRTQAGDSVSSKDVVRRINITVPPTLVAEGKVDLNTLIDRAQGSLAEVKGQTEYQDAKAARLLTVVAFLTAAVGTVFGKLLDLYPLHDSVAVLGYGKWLVGAAYAVFGLYLLAISAGALVIFQAMRTRFVWPDDDDDAATTEEAKSLLFYRQIVRTTPEGWGRAFSSDGDALLRSYYRSYAVEAYLVATKVADKLRFLDPGQRLLLWGIRLLLGFFILVILVVALIPPVTQPKAPSGQSFSIPSTQSLSPSTATTPRAPPVP